jgi:hypothetical protein
MSESDNVIEQSSDPTPQPEDPIQQAINSLKEVAAGSLDHCIHAKYIALTNSEVRSKLKVKWTPNHPTYEFKGIRCLYAGDRANIQYVLFEFVWKSGQPLFNPSILVGVNVIYGRVVFIQDPYTHIPSTASRRNVTARYHPFPLTCLTWGLWLKTQIALWEVLGSPRLLDIECSPDPRRLYPSTRLIETPGSNTLESD